VKEREKRLKEVEEVLRRSLERQEPGESEEVRRLKTDTEFLKALQKATEAVEEKYPDIYKRGVEAMGTEEPCSEFHNAIEEELKRLSEEKEGE